MLKLTTDLLFQNNNNDNTDIYATNLRPVHKRSTCNGRAGLSQVKLIPGVMLFILE